MPLGLLKRRMLKTHSPFFSGEGDEGGEEEERETKEERRRGEQPNPDRVVDLIP